MGYDATTAGWALAYGGIGSLMIMPVVGRLTTVLDSRILVFVGLCINAYAVYLMHLYTPQIDYVTAWWPRFIQGFGLGSTFVSLTTLTMSRISQVKMGNATGIFNLMRNLGGSFGIATATTLLARRGQFHQSRLVEHLTPYSLPFNEWRQRMTDILPDLGSNWHLWNAPQVVSGLYQEVLKQAQMLAFCDDYWFFTIVFLLLLPLVFLMRHIPRHEQEPGVEALP
jgi:DHA2 family multidrug resistance protein